MISVENIPANDVVHDSDFTTEHYRELLRLAKSNWYLESYENIRLKSEFLLWRHDVDCSLSRSLALAKLEQEEGVRATYFINPHSEFYNLVETKQYQIVKQILSLGHDLGLHFDAAFYGVESESALDRLVAKESLYLENWFGVKPVAFSFHNPVAAHLDCDADEYVGLTNCYSKRFKEQVAYCSDSNGYWRFRRVFDVLSEKKDARLQVLTHPGWWQDQPMPPRQRIFRAAYGRAAATMHIYDEGLEEHGRLNHAGAAAAIRVLKEPRPQQYELCDFLWNQGAFDTLFLELWRLHESQINRLCRAQLRKVWSIPATEVNAFFDSDGVLVDGWRLFEALFETKWQVATGTDLSTHKEWVKVRNQLIHARSSSPPAKLEQGCVYLCDVLQKIAEWGLKQPFAYDGLAHLGSIGLPTHKTAEGTLEENLSDRLGDLPQHLFTQWQDFMSKLSDLNQA